MPAARVKAKDDPWQSWYAGLVGLWLALVMVKIGHPVILDDRIATPADPEELLIGSWPALWGYALALLVCLPGLKWWRRPKGVPLWLLIVPLLWLIWQMASATHTLDWALTSRTLKQFCACAAIYYFGVFVLSQIQVGGLFWLGVIGAFVVVMITGWRQHFGGLEETRRYFFSLPNWQSFPPEFIEKLSSSRIYGTLFYPNALAGVVILLLPPALIFLWERVQNWPTKWLAVGATMALGLGCLSWSGSKTGWLIALAQAMVALLKLGIRPRIKIAIVSVILVTGIAGFWIRYERYFAKGATSVSARVDYWSAAWQGLRDRPLFGSGPGTFAKVYSATKPPGAEMARLAHNDYLQQGSDSGWPGLITYAIWVLGGVALVSRRSWRNAANAKGTLPGFLAFGVCLGLVGIAAQGLVEFWLYIPAIAWPVMLFLGWATAEGCQEAPSQVQPPLATGGSGITSTKNQ